MQFYKAPEFCCAQDLATYRCQPVVPFAEIRREARLAEAAGSLAAVPAALEEPEVAHYTDRRKLIVCECAGWYYMYYRDPTRPRCLACCKATGRLSLISKAGIPRPVRATHITEFDAYLGRFDPGMPGLPWKLLMAERTEHVGHTGAAGHSVRAVTELQLLPLNWYRPMMRSRVDVLPPALSDPEAAAGLGLVGPAQFYTEFEGHLKFFLAGVRADEGSECSHLGIECRHLACCGSRAQLFYSPSGDVTRPLTEADVGGGEDSCPRTLLGDTGPRILLSVQEYLWNWFTIPDIGDLTEADFDHWLHPVVQGFAFTGVEKDEATGACCSFTLMTRQSRRRCGLRPLRAGADRHGHTAGSRECEQLLDWVVDGQRRQRLSTVWHCAQLPLLMARDLPNAATVAAEQRTQAPAPLLLHPDAGAQERAVRCWLSEARAVAAECRHHGPLLLLRPTDSALGRHRWADFGELFESAEAAFTKFRGVLGGEELATSAYLELPQPAEADTVLALVAAAAGCLHLVAAGEADGLGCWTASARQAFGVCLLDLETFETAMADAAVLGQAALLHQLRGHCGAPGPDALAATPRFVRGLMHIAEHAWQLARDTSRLAETQLVTDRATHWVDDQASIRIKSDAWLHLDLLTQLVYDLTQRRPRTPELLLAACAIATWPAPSTRAVCYEHFGISSAPEATTTAPPSKAQARAAKCFAWLVSVIERSLSQSAGFQAQFLGSATLCWPAASAALDTLSPGAAARNCLAQGLDSPGVAPALGHLVRLTAGHSALLVLAGGKLHAVNVLRLWRLVRVAGGNRAGAPEERSFFRADLPASCVASVWSVDAAEVASVSLHSTGSGCGNGCGSGISVSINLTSGVAITADVPSDGLEWTGCGLELHNRWRPLASGAVRLVRMLESLTGRSLLKFRSGRGPQAASATTYERPDGPLVLCRALLDSGLASGKSDCLLASCLQAFITS